MILVISNGGLMTVRFRNFIANRLMLIGVIGAALTLTGPGLAGCASSGPASDARLRVHVSGGWLQGAMSQGVREFLGIRYAAPPARFAPPQPALPWQGVRSATAHGPACIQFQPMGVPPGQATSEDCLYLDVYTPAGARPGARLPVLFWIHGGNFTQGSGVLYGGQRFASLTNSIFVSINYRLGVYGFLALPQLAAGPQGTGNYGLLDQIAALRWVRSNIAAFGGDPRRVTIDGQSAGSGSVCDLLASPLAAGLFQRGILESGPCITVAPMPLPESEVAGQGFAAEAGCGTAKDVVTCLRDARTPALVAAAQQDVVNTPASGTPVLPQPPAAAFANSHWHKVPLIIGGVRDEGKLFFDTVTGMTAGQYASGIDAQYGSLATAVLARYPLRDYPTPFYARAAVFTDSLEACPDFLGASAVASQVPTWEEEFNDPASPVLVGYQPRGVNMSNAHSAELAFLWNFTPITHPLTPAERQLGVQMDRYWAAFARTGNPNVPGQVGWPRVTAGTHPVLDLRPTGSTVSTSFSAEHQCGFWATTFLVR
jgi:para-nitrobenzyl esterase